MAKQRVYELAKELNKENKEIIKILKDQGAEIKNHMSTVTEEQASKVKEFFKPKKKEQPKKD